MGKLKVKSFGYAAAVISAGIMLITTVFEKTGLYSGYVVMMREMHMFYDPTVIGTITGMLEAAVISFIAAAAFAWTYNKF